MGLLTEMCGAYTYVRVAMVGKCNGRQERLASSLGTHSLVWQSRRPLLGIFVRSRWINDAI